MADNLINRSSASFHDRTIGISLITFGARNRPAWKFARVGNFAHGEVRQLLRAAMGTFVGGVEGLLSERPHLVDLRTAFAFKSRKNG